MTVLRTVNAFRPKVVVAPLDSSKVRGKCLFETCYSNVALIAKKCSGKSNLIYNAVLECAGPNTVVHIFASTVHQDPTYAALTRKLDRKKIEHTTHSDLGTLASIVASPTEDPEVPPPPGARKDRSGLQSPAAIIVLDDMGTALRSPVVTQLLKTNRHHHLKILIGTQHIHDLTPAAIMQLDYCILFAGHPEDKLTRIHQLLDLAVPLPRFLQLYAHATSEAFRPLIVDVRRESYRAGFNKKYFF